MGFLDPVREWWSVSRDTLDLLTRAFTLELDLLALYDRVLPHVGHPGTADQLAQFRNEHAQHVDSLLAWRPLARRIPRARRNERRRVRTPSTGFGGLLAITDDTEGALHEVRSLEDLAQKTWAALSGTVPERVGRRVERVRADAKRHVRFLNRLIQTRVWDLEEHVPDY